MRIELTRETLIMIFNNNYNHTVLFFPESYPGGPYDPRYSIVSGYKEVHPLLEFKRIYIFIETLFFKRLAFDSYQDSGGDLNHVEDFDIESPFDFKTGELLTKPGLYPDFSTPKTLETDIIRYYDLDDKILFQWHQEFNDFAKRIRT